MKKLTALATCLLALFTVGSAAADAQDLKTLSRVFDPVVVTGRTCGLTGSPTSDYGLYALKDGRLVPVPVQIDEKNTDGKF
ncbi:MAG: hypothetical protein ACOZBW_13900, partial [Thermodesulfobacteriota bacterium]